jgi:hypothetical protein
LGVQVGAGVRWRFVSLEAAARIETTVAPASVDSGDRIEASLYSGVLAPCGFVGPWTACVTARVGALQGRALDVVDPNLGTSTFAALGAQAGYVLELGSVVSLRARALLELPLVRTTLRIDRVPAWTAPPIAGGLALGATFSVP